MNKARFLVVFLCGFALYSAIFVQNAGAVPKDAHGYWQDGKFINVLVVNRADLLKGYTGVKSPNAACYYATCDGLYPDNEGCISSNSVQLGQAQIYDSGGGIAIGTMHSYRDKDCEAIHFGFNVNNGISNCIHLATGGVGHYDNEDNVNYTKPQAQCPNHWVNSVMDEYDHGTQPCMSFWNGGQDSYSKAYIFKMIVGGSGC